MNLPELLDDETIVLFITKGPVWKAVVTWHFSLLDCGRISHFPLKGRVTELTSYQNAATLPCDPNDIRQTLTIVKYPVLEGC